MQEVGTTLVEARTPQTLHPTTNPPTKQEAAIQTGGPVPLRSQSLRRLSETEGKRMAGKKLALGKRKMVANMPP